MHSELSPSVPKVFFCVFDAFFLNLYFVSIICSVFFPISTGYREPLEGQDDDSPKAPSRRRAPHRDWRLGAHNEAPLLMAPYGYSCKPPQCGNPSGPGVLKAL